MASAFFKFLKRQQKSWGDCFAFFVSIYRIDYQKKSINKFVIINYSWSIFAPKWKQDLLFAIKKIHAYIYIDTDTDMTEEKHMECFVLILFGFAKIMQNDFCHIKLYSI